ncbi:fumarylacetoacetate hydrolase family protein [Pseudogemmobacter faecipullorum]|uniref:Fumarylacetoacetate hydrolase family protein n=1 Tax=Pseudogemmobacter faecipullorum TaxID=2755041 RepID=A0ABS8CL87_9RHOB|nr:fumarylacetoacetate hydrolase family protein [Pseudogemmobacter faecipullorum]MCB5410161.1 fumarylacetoacetate hydrolase family protein [Pseudogemmobacter faecipullorum]
MKLLRYGARGAEKPGMLDAKGQLRDLSAHIPDLAGAVLSDLSRLKEIDPESLPLVGGSPRIGACIGNVGKFLCIGLNYSDHAAEAGLRVPREPVLFAKYTSAICGPDDPILIPRGSEKTDWEVELGFVIGKPGKYIAEADALSHIAGYFVANDVSERNFQTERSGQWSKGKGCDNFGPIGPWLVTPDEVPDPNNLQMWLKVNDQLMQNGTTANMVFKVPFLVAYLSQFFTLHPGDVVITGTPPGVGMGMTPPRFLKAGDRVSLGIDGLGEQHQLCENDA